MLDIKTKQNLRAYSRKKTLGSRNVLSLSYRLTSWINVKVFKQTNPTISAIESQLLSILTQRDLVNLQIEILEMYGIFRSFFAKYHYHFILTTCSLIIISFSLIGFFSHDKLTLWPSAALVVFCFGLYQWRYIRTEISMDKFYERLDRANQKVDSFQAARTLVTHLYSVSTVTAVKENAPLPDYVLDREEYEKDRYVYTELDNLEYVIEKYSIGFMSTQNAYRGVQCFSSRCFSIDFSKRALRLVKLAGYNDNTIGVVEIIVECPLEYEKVYQSLKKYIL